MLSGLGLWVSGFGLQCKVLGFMVSRLGIGETGKGDRDKGEERGNGKRVHGSGMGARGESPIRVCGAYKVWGLGFTLL